MSDIMNLICLPRVSDCATLDGPIFFSDLCHLTLWNRSEGLPPFEKPSVGAMEPLFVSGRILPLLWVEKNVGISIMSSMCVLLSHRKLHDGECLIFLQADTSTGVTHGWGLCFAAIQQLAPISIDQQKSIWRRFDQSDSKCREFNHVRQSMSQT